MRVAVIMVVVVVVWVIMPMPMPMPVAVRRVVMMPLRLPATGVDQGAQALQQGLLARLGIGHGDLAGL